MNYHFCEKNTALFLAKNKHRDESGSEIKTTLDKKI